MKTIGSLILLLAISCPVSSQELSFTHIDSVEFSGYKLLGYPEELWKKYAKIQSKSFEISALITWKQYKRFLEDARRIKGSNVANSFTPKLPAKHLKACLETEEFDHLPATGVSWSSAREYCRWRTVVDHSVETSMIYDLPKRSEWLTALHQLDSKKKKHDLNNTYSDWTLNAKDESMPVRMDYLFDAEVNDPPVMKRKLAIGASFKYRLPNLKDYTESYYQDSSYAHIGFRLVGHHSLRHGYECYDDWLSNYFINYWGELDELDPVKLKFPSYSVEFSRHDGRLKGSYTSHYSNGTKKAEGVFYNNQRVGKWTVWDSLGTKLNERLYTNSFSYVTTFPPAANAQVAALRDVSSPALELNEEGFFDYPHIWEKSVHWAKRIWSRITPEHNDNLFTNDCLYQLLALKAQSGNIVIYDTLAEWFRDTISSEEFTARRTGKIVAYEVAEDEFLDLNRRLGETRIIAICPMTEITQNGNTRLQPMGWFYFPELRPIFAQAHIRNRCQFANSPIRVARRGRTLGIRNPLTANEQESTKTLDDLFLYRDYEWKTVSETSINGKISLTESQIINETEDQLVEGWPFRVEQIEREHDFWIYLNSSN